MKQMAVKKSDDGARVEKASSPLPPKGTQWRSPHDARKRETVQVPEHMPLYTRAVTALSDAGVAAPDNTLIAATIIAQALDRHGKRLAEAAIEAAAVGRYRT